MQQVFIEKQLIYIVIQQIIFNNKRVQNLYKAFFHPI